MTDTITNSKTTDATLKETYAELEEWKKSVLYQFTYLRAELGEDMQL